MCCVRIYGTSTTDWSDAAVEDVLGRGVMALLDKTAEVYHFELPVDIASRHIAIIPAIESLLGVENVQHHTDIFLADSLHLTCTFLRALQISHTFSLHFLTPLKPWTPSPLPESPDCPVCKDTTPSLPLSCGHIYCSTCFHHQTHSDARPNQRFALPTQMLGRRVSSPHRTAGSATPPCRGEVLTTSISSAGAEDTAESGVVSCVRETGLRVSVHT
jgi:hypothetical protein